MDFLRESALGAMLSGLEPLDHMIAQASDNTTPTTTTPSQSTVPPGVLSCQRRQVELSMLLHFSLFPACTIILILAFLQRRKNKWPNCCWGRPGLIIPVNFLDNFEHRWSYAAAYGAIANTILAVFAGGSVFRPTTSTIGTVLLGFIVAVEVCVNYYPFFACLTTDYQLVGAITGFLYSLMWLAANVINLLECIDPAPRLAKNVNIVIQAPSFVCLTVLVVKFLHTIAKIAQAEEPHTRQEDAARVAFPHQTEHVRTLIKSKKRVAAEERLPEGVLQKVKCFFEEHVYKNLSHFKYSTRVMCTILVTCVVTYQLGTMLVYLNGVAITSLGNVARDLLNSTGNTSHINPRTRNNVTLALRLLHVSWHVTTGLSFGIFAINVYRMLKTYRDNSFQVYRGDFSFLPEEIDLSNAELTACGMKYSGFQIAFMLWGYLILNAVLWVLAIFLSFVIILPLANGVTSILQFFAELLIFPLILNYILYRTQVFMSKRIFLQDKLKPTDEDQPMAITNRRGFHVANYFFFIGNIQMGFFSSLVRIGKGIFFGVLWLGRVDMCILMSKCETMDKGFMAYIGMLHLECSHNHPVLRVFCQLLLDSVHKNTEVCVEDGITTSNEAPLPDKEEHEEGKEEYKEENIGDNESGGKQRKIKPRLMWHLAYTLINNPEVIRYRNESEKKLKPDSESESETDPEREHMVSQGIRVRIRKKLANLEKEIERLRKKKKKKNAVGCQVPQDNEEEVVVITEKPAKISLPEPQIEVLGTLPDSSTTTSRL